MSRIIFHSAHKVAIICFKYEVFRIMSNSKWVWQQNNFPNFEFDVSKVRPLIRRYDEASGALYGAHSSMTKENQSEATLNILVSEAISTAEIEGERLDRNSVRNSLKRHLGLPHNQRERDQKSEGMASMLLATRTDPNKELDDKTLFGWHRDMLGDGRSLLHKDLLVGEWRNEPMQIVSGHIGYENIDYEAPPPDLVPTLMNEFCDWFNSTDTEVNSNSIYSEYNVGPVRSALAHLWFEVVHPFDDGNGRVGRGLV